MTIRRKAKRFTGTVLKEREDVRDEYVLLANAWQMLYSQNPSRAMLRDFTPEIFSVAFDFLFGEKVLGKTVKVSLGSVAWEFFLEFELAFRKRVFKAVNHERRWLVKAMRTAIHGTELYQDEFLTGLRVLSMWLHSTASSSSAPTRPAPAGPSGPLSDTAELAEILRNLSKTVASLAKRKDSSNDGGADTKKARRGQGQGQQGRQRRFRRAAAAARVVQRLHARVAPPTVASLAPDGAKICFKFQKNVCSDRACPFVHKCAAYLGASHGFDRCSCVKPQ